MIDPADQQTQSLPLDEQPAKRRRGRPATGNAMTPAERQKAYRERMKSQREETERELHNAYATSRVDESYSEDLWQELEQAKAKIADLEKQLAQRNGNKETPKTAPGTGVWTVRFKMKGSRTWKYCDPQIDFEGIPWTYEGTREHIKDMVSVSPSTTWQAIRDDGLIYDPKAAK